MWFTLWHLPSGCWVEKGLIDGSRETREEVLALGRQARGNGTRHWGR